MGLVKRKVSRMDSLWSPGQLSQLLVSPHEVSYCCLWHFRAEVNSQDEKNVSSSRSLAIAFDSKRDARDRMELDAIPAHCGFYLRSEPFCGLFWISFAYTEATTKLWINSSISELVSDSQCPQSIFEASEPQTDAVSRNIKFRVYLRIGNEKR